MARRLKLSPAATDQMYRVRERLRLDKKELLWTLRIALSRSLQEGSQLAEPVPVKQPPATKPFEIDVSTIEQKEGTFFRALIQQLYGRKLADEEYEHILQLHIEHGLHLVDQETPNFKGYEYLVAIAQKGMRGVSATDNVRRNGQQIEPKEYADTGYRQVISIRIGTDTQTKEPHIIHFNKTDEHLNNYVGIIGKPGSGKTTFAMHFIRELRKASNFHTNVIMFDYAKGDIASDKKFVKDIRAEVIKVDEQPIPLNLFQMSEYSDKSKRFTAERLVEIVKNVEANIGKKQEANLYNAIISAYEYASTNGRPYPDFHTVREELEAISPKPDSLTSVFRPLTEHDLFASREQPIWDSLLTKTVIFDLHTLPAMKDLCVFFVLNEMYRQLMALPDSAVDPVTKARTMRTVIVLDEAHHFLKSKKRVAVLENMIREIRSKGASVMLLSQSPDDFDKADFNFLELLEFVYVLGCNPSSPKFLEQVFGVSAQQAKKMMKELSGFGQGEALSRNEINKMIRIKLMQ